MPRHNAKRMKVHEGVAIADLIRAHLIPNKEQEAKPVSERVVAYADGWNDAKVAETSGWSESQVARVRQLTVGALTAGGGRAHRPIHDRLDTLETQVVDLKAQVGDLARRAPNGDFLR